MVAKNIIFSSNLFSDMHCILWLLKSDILFIFQATFYPGLCEPISQGGLGFDYCVNLSVSETWSNFLENVPDHDWSMSKVEPFNCDTLS